jgi:hypothetical protein
MSVEEKKSSDRFAGSSARALIGITLAVILTASVIPTSLNMRAAYAETFKTFDGSSYVSVPSSPDLQLPKYAIEVKFRISELSELRGYLVSKSAGTGDGNLDHNYALYVTKYGTLGGGFKATDGKYYYIYSWPPVSLGSWHVVKLIYDGRELRMKVDGELERTLTVGKLPDTSGTGPLMIGGHSNEQDRSFVGDIDYVSIIDRRDYDSVYFNDFTSTTTSNTPPAASNDSDSTDENTSTKTNVLANDSDSDGDALKVTSVTNPPHGTATINADMTVTYKPDLNYVGPDSYQYTVSDGKGGTDTAMVSMQVRDISSTSNNPPNAVDDAATTTKDTSVTTSVLSNDNDADGDPLTVVSVTGAPNGAVTKNSGGTITYKPDPGFVGTDSYQYTISDGIATDTAKVTVSVSDTAPPPPSGSDCSTLPVKNFRGVVFVDHILGKKERSEPGTVSVSYVTENLKYIKSNGFNTIRVPYYWEAYVNSPEAFMAELDLIAKTAEENDMCVLLANFHYYTSSYWQLEVEGKSGGRGFPSFVVKDFPKKTDYVSTAGPFWEAFLSNNISINGKKVWDVQSEYIKKVINKVDSYDSIIGYEILNEPHLFAKTQYDKLGNYHTYLAKEMREVTDKKIFFDRETTRGFARDASLEYKIVPRDVTGLVYGVQLYSIPTPGSYALKQVNNFKELADKYGTEVFIEEMAADNQSDIETLLSVFKSYGYGWTWYAWKRSSGSEYGESIYESSTVAPNTVLKLLRAALDKYY